MCYATILQRLKPDLYSKRRQVRLDACGKNDHGFGRSAREPILCGGVDDIFCNFARGLILAVQVRLYRHFTRTQFALVQIDLT